MAEKTSLELITLKGRVKMTVSSGTSINGDDFYRTPLEINETEKNGNRIDNEFDSIMLIFWKKDFNTNIQTIIADLTADQTITVHGYLGGRDNQLMKVIEIDTENDLFI